MDITSMPSRLVEAICNISYAGLPGEGDNDWFDALVKMFNNGKAYQYIAKTLKKKSINLDSIAKKCEGAAVILDWVISNFKYFHADEAEIWELTNNDEASARAINARLRERVYNSLVKYSKPTE